jgi:Putative peptidoglycan binding domain
MRRSALMLVSLFLVWAPGALASPLDGSALWVAQPSSPAVLAGEAEQAGIGTLFVKAGDGSTPDAAFDSALVGGLREAGLSVCGWTFDYGVHPAAEATVALDAVHAGAQCLVIDAEEAYDGRYGAAQSFVHTLRRELGARFPIALAGQAEVLEHPTFPYSVFFGPGGFQVDMPQVYWRELGSSVAGAFQASIPINSIYGRPIAPVGQLFDGVTLEEVGSFRTLASEYGGAGFSLFDLESTEPAALAPVLRAPIPALALRVIAPTVRPGADGDEVLWAQELLNAAGARLPVGGFFGATTSRAVSRFQSRHHLHADGLLDGATWSALERLHAHAREPSWAKHPPLSAR